MSALKKVRKILVTGANKGIGFEACKLLSKNPNNHIIATCRNFNYIPLGDKDIGYEIQSENFDKLSRLNLLKQKFSNQENVDFVELDIRYETSISNAFDYILDKYQSIDVLINNAAIEINNESLDDLIVIKRHLFNNYTGSVKYTLTFIPILNQNRLIIFVASRSRYIGENIIDEKLWMKLMKTL